MNCILTTAPLVLALGAPLAHAMQREPLKNIKLPIMEIICAPEGKDGIRLRFGRDSVNTKWAEDEGGGWGSEKIVPVDIHTVRFGHYTYENGLDGGILSLDGDHEFSPMSCAIADAPTSPLNTQTAVTSTAAALDASAVEGEALQMINDCLAAFQRQPDVIDCNRFNAANPYAISNDGTGHDNGGSNHVMQCLKITGGGNDACIAKGMTLIARATHPDLFANETPLNKVKQRYVIDVLSCTANGGGVQNENGAKVCETQGLIKLVRDENALGIPGLENLPEQKAVAAMDAAHDQEANAAADWRQCYAIAAQPVIAAGINPNSDPVIITVAKGCMKQRGYAY